MPLELDEPIANDPIYIHDGVGEDRNVHKIVRLFSPDLDLIHEALAYASDYNLSAFGDDPEALSAAARVTSIMEMLESLPRGSSGQHLFLKIHILPTIEEVEEERTPEYEYEDREIPLDTPSLDTSFHDHEMDID